MDITCKGIVHTIDEAAGVAVERDHVYRTDQGPLGFDLYRPPQRSTPCPAVVFVTGFPDPAATAIFGKPLKDWASYIDWARLVAASGLAGIAYANREPADAAALVRHLRTNAGSLGIDHAAAPHAFDLLDDSPRTRAVIEEVVAFLRRALA